MDERLKEAEEIINDFANLMAGDFDKTTKENPYEYLIKCAKKYRARYIVTQTPEQELRDWWNENFERMKLDMDVGAQQFSFEKLKTLLDLKARQVLDEIIKKFTQDYGWNPVVGAEMNYLNDLRKQYESKGGE